MDSDYSEEVLEARLAEVRQDHADLDADVPRKRGLRDVVLGQKLAEKNAGMEGGFDHGETL